ncbi:hypothetical protein HYY75_07755, partial [bacterium]|nr:hypothetical protein [bacterium]
MRARYDGVVDEVLVTVGDIKREGDPLAVIKKAGVQRSANLPLIKMVRITRIPIDVYQGGDLSDIKNRCKIYDYIKSLRDKFLKNFMSSSDSSSVEAFFADLNGNDRTLLVSRDKLSELPKLTPPSNFDEKEAMNFFIRSMMHEFVPPLGLVATAAKTFAGSGTYELGVSQRDITPQLKELLEIHGEHLHGDKDYYLRQLDTIPKKLFKEGKNIYKIESKKYDGATRDFIELVDKYTKPDQKGKTEDFIKDSSSLVDAAVFANIYLNQGTPWTPNAYTAKLQNGEITDPENYFRWKNSKGEEGYWKYAPESAISIQKVPVPYYYTNTSLVDPNKPVNKDDPDLTSKSSFRMKESDLLNFFKKHYDEGTVS